MAYSYYAQITVDKTKVGETGANFAVLFSGTYDGTGKEPDLRTVANGGHVQNTASGGASGSYTVPADLVFSPNIDGSSKYDFEIEKYNASTGEIVAWVQCGVSTAADTVFYVAYGDIGVTTSQENVAGTWDANFVMVHHLHQTAGNYIDSTSNSHDSDVVSVESRTRTIIDNAPGFVTASSHQIEIPDHADFDIANVTLEAIVNLDVKDQIGHILSKDAAGYNDDFYLQFGADNHLDLMYHRDSNGTEYGITSDNALTTGTNYWIIGQIDGSGMRMYVNKILQADEDVIALEGIKGSTVKFHIGEHVQGANPMDGIIDEVRVSDTTRTANYATTCHNNQSSPSTFYSVGDEQSVTIPRSGFVLFQCPGIV